jgi:chromate transport protein ChrA
MAIAQQNTPISLHNSQKVNLLSLWELGKSQLQRLFWHSHAYGTIFSILIFSLVSLIFLAIHWTYRKLFFTHRLVETNKWDLNSSN